MLPAGRQYGSGPSLQQADPGEQVFVPQATPGPDGQGALSGKRACSPAHPLSAGADAEATALALASMGAAETGTDDVDAADCAIVGITLDEPGTDPESDGPHPSRPNAARTAP